MSDKFEEFASAEDGAMQWISVKDRLPEHGSYCYIFCDDGECDSWVHYFTDDKRGKIWTSTDTGAPPISSYANVITHWMPHDLNAHKESEWHDISEVMPSLSGENCMVLVDGELSPHCWDFGRSEGDNLLVWWCFGDNALYDGKNEYLLDENVITHWKRWRTPKPPKVKEEPEEVDEVCEAIQCPTCNEITTSSKSAKMIADDGVCGICGTGNSLDDQLFAFGLNRDDLAEMGEHAWWSLQHEVGHK